MNDFLVAAVSFVGNSPGAREIMPGLPELEAKLRRDESLDMADVHDLIIVCRATGQYLQDVEHFLKLVANYLKSPEIQFVLKPEETELIGEGRYYSKDGNNHREKLDIPASVFGGPPLRIELVRGSTLTPRLVFDPRILEIPGY